MIKKQTFALVAGLVLTAAAASAGAQVYVRIGPPRPPVREVVPVAPRPGWVWRPGYHRWDGRQYVWTPGAYAAPPRPYARWVPGHWRQTRRGWYWIEGRWE